MDTENLSVYDLATAVSELDSQGFVNFFDELADCLGWEMIFSRHDPGNYPYELSKQIENELIRSIKAIGGGI
jgi:hypothetical protein